MVQITKSLYSAHHQTVVYLVAMEMKEAGLVLGGLDMPETGIGTGGRGRAEVHFSGVGYIHSGTSKQGTLWG